MSALFSPRFKFETWRRLWLWLAEEERRLGLPVSDEAIAADARAPLGHRLRRRRRRGGEDPPRRDGARARLRRRGARRPRHHPLGRDVRLRHRQRRPDPDARGARARRAAPRRGAAQAARLRARPSRTCPRSPTRTSSRRSPRPSASAPRSGPRTCCIDLEEVRAVREGLRFLGAKGATGTQASFLRLFDGDSAKVEELDRALAAPRRASRAARWSRARPTRASRTTASSTRSPGSRSRAHKIGDRPAPAPARGRARGAVRGVAGRLLGDALQAQPDARRAHLLARAPRHRALARHGDDRRHPVARAHARRLGQQAHRRARGLPRDRRDPDPARERPRRPRRPPRGLARAGSRPRPRSSRPRTS